MRLHDALMCYLDSLLSEGQRLRQQAAALGVADAGMLGWMSEFQQFDNVCLAAHHYAALWADEQQQLRRLKI